jgi:hypothetical protein
MKPFIISLLILIGIVILFQSFSYFSVSAIEKHNYQVIKTYDDFEIRQYETALFSSVILPASSYEESSNKGFRVLAGYIFGGNETGEKIAMTSPVAMELGDSMKMSFMVPSNYAEKDLPKPNSDQIFFEKKEGSVMAAIRFGGWASDSRIETHKQELAAALSKQGIAHSGKFIYLGYNPPYTVVGRRNEIIVELTGFNIKSS